MADPVVIDKAKDIDWTDENSSKLSDKQIYYSVLPLKKGNTNIDDRLKNIINMYRFPWDTKFEIDLESSSPYTNQNRYGKKCKEEQKTESSTYD